MTAARRPWIGYRHIAGIRLMGAMGVLSAIAACAQPVTRAPTPGTDHLLARENLVPWELRWDEGGAKLPSQERARVLKAKGLQRYGFQYSVGKAAELEAQVAEFHRQGLKASAVYFWLSTNRPGEDPNVKAAFESFKRLGIRPQIWVSQSTAFLPKTPEGWKQQFAEAGFDFPKGLDLSKAMHAAFSSGNVFTEAQKERFFKALHRVYSDEAHLPKTPQEQIERLERETRRIASLAHLASQYGFEVGLYNHNGWLGLMDNQLAIIEQLKKEDVTNVGIVYTFWHARDHLHDEVKNFMQVWAKIKPHVRAIGISGVRGEMESLYPSQGENELPMLRIVQQSGWRGPVGVLALNFGTHPQIVLSNVLRGVDWLAAELQRPGFAGPRPKLQ